ncbi:MAG: leader peptidase (prepilin peptidase)/N-methyltransferase [Planctomycetota bacterium]|jgi:leader peptidase (prepilin peptidase)/N-methyltransferase
MGTAVFEVGAALFGACIGSFLNVVIWRLPQEDPARRKLGGRSHCPSCGVQIRWFDNVPILGWLILRGKARCCGKTFSPRYPFVELLTAALFYALASWPPFGAVFMTDAATGMMSLDAAAMAAFVASVIFASMLVALTFIDFDTYLLPDVLTKPGMVIGLIAGTWPGVAGVMFHDTTVSLELRHLLTSLVGLLVGGGVTWGVRIAGSAVFKKEAMGFGDVKLMAMIGAFVGWQGSLLTLFLGCVFGAIVGSVLTLRTGNARIPFGPYLAMGAIVTLFGRETILHWLFVRWPQWQRDNPSSVMFVLGIGIAALIGLLWVVRRGRR